VVDRHLFGQVLLERHRRLPGWAVRLKLPGGPAAMHLQYGTTHSG
jgi:hypothetical protein